jgi:hypothetical protein
MAIGYRIPGEMWPTELGWLYYQLAESKLHVEVGTFCGHDYWSADSGVVDAVQRQFSGRHQVATNTRIWWVRK